MIFVIYKICTKSHIKHRSEIFQSIQPSFFVIRYPLKRVSYVFPYQDFNVFMLFLLINYLYFLLKENPIISFFFLFIFLFVDKYFFLFITSTFSYFGKYFLYLMETIDILKEISILFIIIIFFHNFFFIETFYYISIMFILIMKYFPFLLFP